MNIIDFFKKSKKYKEPCVLYDFDIPEEELKAAYAIREIEYKKHRNFWNIYEVVVEDFDFFYRHKIKYPIKDFFTGLHNIWKFKKVIWNDRWWDYGFMTDLLYFKIKDMYDNWDKSIYLDSEIEKETLYKMLQKLDIMKDIDKTDEEQNIAKNEFFELFKDNYYKFWD